VVAPVKVLATSDWHADHSTSGVDRFEDIRAAALQTVEVAIQERVSLYAFLGDLADPDDGPRALRAVGLALEVQEKLHGCGIAQVWIAGNHDVIEDGSGRTVLSPLAKAERSMCWVFENLPMRMSDPHGSVAGASVLAIPYPAASASVDVAEHVRRWSNNVGERGLVLAHCTNVDGARQGEETLEMPRGRGVRLPQEDLPKGWTVLNGHFHTPQVTPAGVIVPGALARLTHGEETNDPRFVLLEI
jgi:DNA repair exonuclease SbcCD nuclease subunit